ncbi:lamin tail domain-containing protein [bacterium AH-315-M05]|nr:lamin tail domain-containing protein [bacterium AH-315-M05]
MSRLFLSCLLLSVFNSASFGQEFCPECIVINEFVVDPDVGENGSPDITGEFIELFNQCDVDIDISCFVLCMMSGANGGECVTIPAGTTLGAGGVFLMGGYGTNCTDPDGTASCDWSGLALDLNWHTCGCVSDPDNPALDGTVGANGDSHYWGVLIDGGEDITLFDNTGAFVDGVTYEGGGGVTNSNWAGPYTTSSLAGCGAVTVDIPESGTLLDIGNTPGGSANDEGWQRDCDGNWTFTQQVGQTPGTPDCATLICSPCNCTPCLILSTDSTEVSCNGGSDGTATVTVSGGTIPYTYLWDDPLSQTTATATGLSAGTYIVTVTDDGGCTATDTVIVTEPPLLVATTSGSVAPCPCPCSGSAYLFPTGGTPPYTIIWSNGYTDQFQTGLCDGTYTVTLTDANGCTASGIVTLP